MILSKNQKVKKKNIMFERCKNCEYNVVAVAMVKAVFTFFGHVRDYPESERKRKKK